MLLIPVNIKGTTLSESVLSLMHLGFSSPVEFILFKTEGNVL